MPTCLPKRQKIFAEIPPEMLQVVLIVSLNDSLTVATFTGSWCYTDDPRIPADVCNIRDCDMREECIIVTRGVGGGILYHSVVNN